MYRWCSSIYASIAVHIYMDIAELQINVMLEFMSYILALHTTLPPVSCDSERCVLFIILLLTNLYSSPFIYSSALPLEYVLVARICFPSSFLFLMS